MADEVANECARWPGDGNNDDALHNDGGDALKMAAPADAEVVVGAAAVAEAAMLLKLFRPEY